VLGLSGWTHWPLWFAAHGAATIHGRNGAREDIAAGRLVQVLDKPWSARFAYYLVTLPGAMQRPEVKAFADWIGEEAKAAGRTPWRHMADSIGNNHVPAWLG
jgi:hypothetical protein